MNPDFVDIAPWPLGRKFVDASGRIFTVYRTIYGNPNAAIQFTIAFENEWSVMYEPGDHPQTAVGFLQDGDHKMIIQSVKEMDDYVNNGHLKIL